jgi:glutamine synthetase
VGRSGRAEPGRQSYSIAAVNEFDPLFDDIYKFCEAQDIEIDTLIHEDGPAQMEINLLHGEPLDLADQVFLFKRTAREAALRHKMYATFMAKPHAKEPGSAMHIHQSIVDTKTAQEHLQQRRRHAVGAVLLAYRRPAALHAGGHVAVLLQRQFLPPHDALPVGADQRAVGLRQPHRGPARADVRRRKRAASRTGSAAPMPIPTSRSPPRWPAATWA